MCEPQPLEDAIFRYRENQAIDMIATSPDLRLN